MALVRVAVHDRVRRDVNVDSLLATDLLLAANDPILEWLNKKSKSLVLPSTATSPAAPVLHQRWSAGEHTFELRITAFDQDGMVSARDVANGSPLRMTLPTDVRDLVDAAELGDVPEDVAIGLDLFEAATSAAHGQVDQRAVFPLRWDGTSRANFVREGDVNVVAGGDASAFVGAASAIGQFVATHGSNRLNVNTAPMEIVEAVFRLTGRGGVEQIAQDRDEGNPVANVPPPAISNDSTATLPTLVTSSDTFAFRVDIRVNRVRPSWWMIYRRGGERGWSCVQRIPVP